MDQFVEEVNEVIREGKVPPKSKTPEHVMGELASNCNFQSNPKECSILRQPP